MRANWAGRWVERAKAHPLMVILFFAAAFLASTTLLFQRGTDLLEWGRETFRWRGAEYSKLSSLKAGFAIETFREALGAPVFRQPARDGELVEESFQGRDYWVQVVRNKDGTVLLYAVTSCDWQFTPSFEIGGQDATITLNISTLASADGDVARYFYPAATANAFFFDEYYGGNPSNYKTFAWGLNDACPDWHQEQERRFQGRDVLPFSDDFPEGLEYEGPIDEAGPPIRRFRRAAIVNTYAETAPFVALEDILPAFQIGVNRIRIRTVSD